MRYELIVIYSDGTKEFYPAKDLEDARRMENNLRMVFGNQITWAGAREKIFL